MPRVLTTNAQILCPHGGVGTSVPSDPKWIVEGGAVLLDGDVGTLTCISIPPCIGYRLQSMKLNSTEVDNRRVMLVTDFTQSFTGFPLTILETHHTFDESSPTPIPAGASPPSVPPELQEFDQPTVVAAPSALAFSVSAFGSSGGNPIALPMTFTMQSQFPNRWLLFMLSPSGEHRDITNGDLPRIAVSPSGGAWPSPVLIVTVAPTGLFMSTLTQGTHYFILTAVNVRGKSQFAQVALTISP